MITGYSGPNFDRYVEHQDNTTIGKVKEKYWEVKQNFRKKIGKKEDEYIIASDSVLDAKLELYHSISDSCIELLHVIEEFQENATELSEQENGLGKFLQKKSQSDKNKAEKLISLFGKTQMISAFQRIQMQTPLQRIFDDVTVFHERAVLDTNITIEKMEKARVSYRAALLWMKDISQNLDPDTYRQLENFRKVQHQVKKTRVRFEKLKIDCMQKIDLLVASRCNLFSNTLQGYQKFIIRYSGNMYKLYSKIKTCFDGYQYYEFSRLKHLTEISRKLAQELAPPIDETSNNNFGGGGSSFNPADLEINFDVSDDDEDFDNKQEYSPNNSQRQNVETGIEVNNNNLKYDFDEMSNSKLLDDLLICGDTVSAINNNFSDTDLIGLKEFAEADEEIEANATTLSTQSSFDVFELLENKSDTESRHLAEECARKDSLKNHDDEFLDGAFSGADMGQLGTFMPSNLLGDADSNFYDLEPLNHVGPVDTDNSNDVHRHNQPKRADAHEELPSLAIDEASSHNTRGLNKITSNTTLNIAEKNAKWLEKFADLDPLANPELAGYMMGKANDNC